MNLAIHNLLIILSFFPIWYFKFYNLVNLNNSVYILITYASMCIIFIYLLSKLKIYKKFFCFFLAIIIFYALDNILGLHRELTFDKSFLATNLKGIYFSSVLLASFILFFIFLILIKLKENGAKIFLVTVVTLIIFNIFDNSKSINKINNFETKTSDNNNLPIVIIITDEMSGINSFESKTKEGKIFDKNSIEFAKKNDLIIYENIYSKYMQTVSSLSSLFNFSEDNDIENIIEEKKKFFEIYALNKNKLFDLFKNISVFQNAYINFCKNINVKKCSTFNPFDNKKYINGFKNNSFTQLINGWKYSGSVSSLFVWRILREYDLIHSSLSPNGEKASFPFLLDRISNDIRSKKFDLIVAHTLVPHRPYGFNENCLYDHKRSLRNYSKFLSMEQKILFHNTDRICTIHFLDNFLSRLEQNKIEYKKIILLSDHGARILVNESESSLKNFFAIKENNGFFKIIREKSFIQDELEKYIID